jgi:hypothetical protein
MKDLKEFIRTTIRELMNEQMLNEGSSDILYHFTNQNSLLNILKTNEFSLTSVFNGETDYEINNKKFFYLSTTRSRSSGYRSGNVKIVIDGRKIKHNNKIIPVDYWRNSKNRNDYETNNDYIYALKSSEQEDRIISDNPIIKNAIKYIISIHILIYEHNINNDLKNIIDVCNNNNIELFLYDNDKNWLNQLNHIDNNLKWVFKNDDSDNETEFKYDVASLLAYKDNGNYNIIVNFLNDSDKINEFDKTLKDIKYKLDDIIKYSDFTSNSLDKIKHSLYQISKKPNYNSKFLLSLLVKSFKKHGVSNIDDYILHLKNNI